MKFWTEPRRRSLPHRARTPQQLIRVTEVPPERAIAPNPILLRRVTRLC